MGLRSDGEDRLGFQKTFFSGQLFLLLEAGAPVVLGGWAFSSCSPGRGCGLSQDFQGPGDTPAFTAGYGDLALMVHAFHALCRLCLAPWGSHRQFPVPVRILAEVSVSPLMQSTRAKPKAQRSAATQYRPPPA